MSGYLEKSNKGSSTVGRYYSGEDPNKRFSRFFGVGGKSRGRKAAGSAEKSWYEELGASVSDVAEEMVDSVKSTYNRWTK